MAHFTHPSFWKTYHALPPGIRDLADKNFDLLKANPQHPSLRFKKVGRFWSARVGIYYRAVALEIPDGFLWIAIVPHGEYDRITRS
jgi:mRNA-degrading endonuclease RelE of RelBE toxin-antitoxin system